MVSLRFPLSFSQPPKTTSHSFLLLHFPSLQFHCCRRRLCRHHRGRNRCLLRRLHKAKASLSPRRFEFLRRQSFAAPLGFPFSKRHFELGRRFEDRRVVSLGSGRFSAASWCRDEEEEHFRVEKHRCLRICSFEESVGRRLRKFGGSDNGELLQRFSSQFKDKYKIPRESAIELARERGHVLRTTIDGEEVGSIESKLLCRSILDLYIGEEPFDKRAKEDVELNLASLLQK